MKRIGAPRPPRRAGSIKFQQGMLDGCVDMLVLFGDGTPRCDRALVFNVFCSEKQRYDVQSGKLFYDKSFVDELIERGYDISTLRFSIDKLEFAS